MLINKLNFVFASPYCMLLLFNKYINVLSYQLTLPILMN